MGPMDFSLARLNHQLWKMRLRSFLDGKAEMSEAELSSHTQCDLGKWLYGGALEKYQSISEMSQLEKAHAQLHASVSRIVKLKNSGNIEDAKQEYAKLVPVSDEIVTVLVTIEQKVKALSL